MVKQKRAVAVHDISCLGKCSLTVALPIISAAGIECCSVPTAVLSTHTGGFTGYTYCDLTSELMPIAAHWKSLGFSFDAFYSGYLGSREQIDLVSTFFDMNKSADSVILVDPVMADHGKLYAGFPADYPADMCRLVARSTIVCPNITEACLMLGLEYRDGPYDKEYIEELVKGLLKLGAKKVVLTGVFFNDTELGAAVSEGEAIEYVFCPRQPGLYHGTGDVFGSALLAAYLCGNTLRESALIAAEYTVESIKITNAVKPEIAYGVHFETALPFLMKRLDLI